MRGNERKEKRKKERKKEGGKEREGEKGRKEGRKEGRKKGADLLIFSFWECSPSSKPPMGSMMMHFPVTSWKVLAMGMVPPSRIQSGSTLKTGRHTANTHTFPHIGFLLNSFIVRPRGDLYTSQSMSSPEITSIKDALYLS